MPTETFRSAFVPHDLAAPVKGAATGPLAGLSVAIKDMYDIAGSRTGGGNPDWLAAHPPATANAAVVAALLAAGATITGKTVCDEFFFSVAGVNAHYGTPLNPRAPGHIPGGSSSGSASAASAGACDVAIGSDTGGSVRVPSAFCGLYGIRPTHGRVSLEGAMPMAPSFDVAGWMSTTPGVFRALGPVLLDHHPVAAAVEKLIVLDDAFAQADEAVATFLQDALDAMAKALPAPTHGAIAPDGFDPWREAFRIIQGREIWQVYGDFVETKRPRFGPGVRERMDFAATVTEAAANEAYAVKAAARDWIRGVVKPGTVLALPTVPCVAPRADAPQELLESFRVRVMRLTCTAGMAGLPQVTIPVGTLEGCPVGLSFIGWAGGDEALLDLAVRLAPNVGATAE
ncbi:amidase [Rhodoplanes azumiensis]|uniref:Amidase n=1 Tax=Rhodoplanes azumiensis TaxID=1897628 RepID=A0ABW5ADH8_9BRAD